MLSNMPPARRPKGSKSSKNRPAARHGAGAKPPGSASAGTIPIMTLQTQSAPAAEEEQVNRYYLSLSTRYKILKLVVILALVAYCIGMVTAYRDDITVENFRYMLRDFNINSTKYTGEFDKISYSAGSDSRFALFKGDLAVVSPDSLYIYGMSGQTEMSEMLNLTDPQIAASDRYILVYDTSDTNPVFSVFNTFSMLYAEKLSKPISAASVANNGYFAIATRTEEYKGAVFVYSASFKQISRIYKDKYIMDVVMRPDGGEVLILSAFDSGGEWCGEIMTVAPGSETATAIITVAGSMPVKACYSKDGGFAVLFDNCIIFYDAEGFEANRYQFGSEIPVGYSLSPYFSMLAFNTTVLGNEKIVRFWDSSGGSIGTCAIEGRILCATSDSSRFYIQTPGQLRVINPYDGTYTSIPTSPDAIELLVYSDGVLVMCASDAATVYKVAGEEEVADETAA